MNRHRRRRQQTAFNTLRQFVRDDESRAAPVEHCELCSVPLPSDHRHLLETATRQVVCACDGCALRFHNVVDGRFKLVPRDTRLFSDFTLPDVQWKRLALPISLVFFFYSTPEERVVALYPSPGGATESLLPLEAWEAIAEANPALQTMEPDVEALLINRVDEARGYYLVPIDTCYELVGLIRMHWQGFTGGEKVWAEIGRFFARLEKEAKPVRAASPEEYHA